MRTFLTTLLTAALTALVGAPALQPYTSLAGDDAPKLEEKVVPATLTVGEVRLSVENLIAATSGENATFTVVAANLGDKKAKASAKARVYVTPRVEEFSRMMALPTQIAELPIQASFSEGGTQRLSLLAEGKLAPGVTVSVTIGEGDNWIEAARYTIPTPPAAEPAK